MAEDIDNDLAAGIEEVSIDDFGSSWVAAPKVGEKTEVLMISKLVRNRKDVVGTKKDGKTFKTNLSNVDYKIEVHTDKGIFTASPWEVFGKLKAAIKHSNSVEGTKPTGAGIRFSVEHVASGMQDIKARDEKKCYKVVLYLKDGSTKEFF